MAKAPRPGVSRREAAKKIAQSVMTVRIGEHPPASFAPKNMRFEVDAAIRRATNGLPFEAYWNENVQLNEHSLLLAWYAARLTTGERVTFDQVRSEFPDPLLVDDYEVTWSTPDLDELIDDPDSDPEA